MALTDNKFGNFPLVFTLNSLASLMRLMEGDRPGLIVEKYHGWSAVDHTHSVVTLPLTHLLSLSLSDSIDINFSENTE